MSTGLHTWNWRDMVDWSENEAACGDRVWESESKILKSCSRLDGRHRQKVEGKVLEVEYHYAPGSYVSAHGEAIC